MSEEEIIEALNEIAARFREQHLCGYEHVVNAVALIVQQQAQIARVREVCDLTERTVLDAMPALEGKVVVYTSLVRRALDGEQ